MKLRATTELTPGMVIGKDVYTDSGLLVLNAGDPVTEEAVKMLRSNKVNFVSIREPEDAIEENDYLDSKELTYNAKLKENPEFKEFKKAFAEKAFELRKLYGDIISGNLKEDLMVSSKRIVNSLQSSLKGTPVLDAVINADDSQDATFVHALDAALIATQLAKWLKFTPEEVEIAGVCGLLYDIGKVTIPSSILGSPRKLTDDQYDVVKQHPQSGYDILKKVVDDDRILNATLQHHEKCDGSGYPNGLIGNEIDKYAKLITIVDAYDAITSQRAYRDDQSPFQVAEIYEMEGYQKYDTGYIMTFLDHMVRSHVGDWCMLSDGTRAKIVMINPRSLSRPVVADGERFIDLSKNKTLTIVKIV